MPMTCASRSIRPYRLNFLGFAQVLAAIALLPAVTAGAATPGSLLWEARPGARDLGPSVEAAGIVAVGNINSDGGVFAYSADSGKLLWKHRGEHTRGNLASDGQRLFVVFGHPNFHLVSLDLKTGKQLWSVSGGDKFGGDDAGVIAESGRLYVMSRDGKLDAFAADTGKKLWEFLYAPVEDPECHSNLAFSNGRIYFGGGMFDRKDAPGKFLWAVDAATGREVWRRESHLQYGSSTDCPSTPVVSGDTVLYTAGHGVAAVRASSGTPLWSHLVTKMSGGYPKALVLSQPATGAGVVFASNSEALLSWSVEDGRALAELRGLVGSDPQIVRMSAYEGTLYFCADLPSDAGAPGKYLLHAMDIATRRILWTHRTNRPVAGFTEWQTSFVTPTASGVYYDNAMLFAKVAR
jgi:outer membrane protein assembly factor BamB